MQNILHCVKVASEKAAGREAGSQELRGKSDQQKWDRGCTPQRFDMPFFGEHYADLLMVILVREMRIKANRDLVLEG